MRIKVQRDQNPCTNPHGKKGISTKAHMEKCACVWKLINTKTYGHMPVDKSSFALKSTWTNVHVYKSP